MIALLPHKFASRNKLIMAVSKPAEASRDMGAEYLRYASRETSESPPPPPEPAPTPAPDGTDKREEKKGISFEKEDLQMSVNYVPPAQHRNLRACMVCSVVQTSAVSCYTPCLYYSTDSCATTRDSRKTAAPTASPSSLLPVILMPSPSALHKSLKALLPWRIPRNPGSPAGSG